MPPRRYTSKPFPPYAYVPGENPHPNRDPQGHSYAPSVPAGVGSATADRSGRRRTWSTDDWRNLEAWLYGVDLFNAGYCWEAHEAWESLWVAVERSSPPALFLQGLIQIAAALLKVRQGVLAGARSLSTDGLDKLRRVAAVQTAMMGLDLAPTIHAFEDYFSPVADGVLPEFGNAPALDLACREP